MDVLYIVTVCNIILYDIKILYVYTYNIRTTSAPWINSQSLEELEKPQTNTIRLTVIFTLLLRRGSHESAGASVGRCALIIPLKKTHR